LKERVVICFGFLLFVAFVGQPLHVEAVEAVRVPQNFLTIQQAIDASTPGGTVLVSPGTYHENITIWKPLTIKSEDRDTTVIDQIGAFSVCHATASNVVVSGLTIRGGSIGVWVGNACQNVTLDSNTMTNNDDGIWITSSNCSLIRNNTITNNIFMGLYIEASSNTIVDSNTITNNTYGIYLQNSENSQICLNTVSLNFGDGVSAMGSNDNAIFYNMVSNNSYGIHLQASNNNSIYENNIVNNGNQVRIQNATTSNWDNGSRGNYWSDYNGTDTNDDGIGDTPYVVDDDGQDKYPLMHTFANVAVKKTLHPKTVAGHGYNASIEILVENQGWETQTTSVTVYLDIFILSTFVDLTLTGRNQTALTSTWQTNAYVVGDYTVGANATAVPYETDTADNVCTWTIHVGVPGDVSSSIPGVYDGRVDMRDIGYIVAFFNAKPSSANWNPNADVNCDGVVNMRDISIAIINFNKHE
jgi:parallel beta-helix repeat protein